MKDANKEAGASPTSPRKAPMPQQQKAPEADVETDMDNHDSSKDDSSKAVLSPETQQAGQDNSQSASTGPSGLQMKEKQESGPTMSGTKSESTGEAEDPLQTGSKDSATAEQSSSSEQRQLQEDTPKVSGGGGVVVEIITCTQVHWGAFQQR